MNLTTYHQDKKKKVHKVTKNRLKEGQLPGTN